MQTAVLVLYTIPLAQGVHTHTHVHLYSHMCGCVCVCVGHVVVVAPAQVGRKAIEIELFVWQARAQALHILWLQLQQLAQGGIWPRRKGK